MPRSRLDFYHSADSAKHKYIDITVETHKSLRFLLIFDDFSKKILKRISKKCKKQYLKNRKNNILQLLELWSSISRFLPKKVKQRFVSENCHLLGYKMNISFCGRKFILLPYFWQKWLTVYFFTPKISIFKQKNLLFYTSFLQQTFCVFYTIFYSEIFALFCNKIFYFFIPFFHISIFAFLNHFFPVAIFYFFTVL